MLHTKTPLGALHARRAGAWHFLFFFKVRLFFLANGNIIFLVIVSEMGKLFKTVLRTRASTAAPPADKHGNTSGGVLHWGAAAWTCWTSWSGVPVLFWVISSLLDGPEYKNKESLILLPWEAVHIFLQICYINTCTYIILFKIICVFNRILNSFDL